MAKTYTGKVGVAYDINTINKLAMRSGLKPLSPNQLKTMSNKQISQYLKAASKVQRMNRADRRSSSRTFRKNAKAVASENLKQSELMHGTIRQGIAELGILGTEGIGAGAGSAAISRQQSASNAITQNTGGGTVARDDDEENNNHTEQGPVYAYKGRSED